MDTNGKAVMMEVEEEEENDLLRITTQELAFYANAANSFLSVGSFPKPFALPPPPPRALNPATTQLLFTKELRSSDVGQSQRMVIPKGYAEKYLPYLSHGEGIFIFMDDMDSDQVWVFRFRFWSNNNSRMFVLEKTGNFVKEHELEVGDLIEIYKDEQTERYGIKGKKNEGEQIIPDDVENVPENEINFPENFLEGTELAFPDFEPAVNFEPPSFFPYYYI